MRLLLIGEDDLADSVAEHAVRWGAELSRLGSPTAVDLADALAGEVDVVVIVSRDDIRVLRYALMVEHARPGVALLVTLFDRTVAGEVVRSVPNCKVIGMTEALVPALLGPCIADELVSLTSTASGRYVGVTRTPVGLSAAPLSKHEIDGRRPVRNWVHAQLRPLEGTTRSLLAGLAGLLLVFLLDTVLGVLVLHEPGVTAAWNAAKTLTTVSASEAAEHAPAWYHALSTLTLLCVLGFSALFTAGLVDRMTSGRFTGIVGARAVPRRGHVIVVGLGQVGTRLCTELQRLGIGVVAVERDRSAPCVPLARSLDIPVMFGRGGDRFLLRKLSLRRARAIVAVSSDVLENIAVAVAARAVAPDQRIVLRAGGDDDVTSESQSLFRIGTACDVNLIGGSFIAATALGLAPLTTFTSGHDVHALLADGAVVDTREWARPGVPAPAH
ncbi:TrkA family protein [Saccharopolyspora erythraea NRRL 2338]|uniref:Possible potassium uptake channel n=2 Tax=Saccharopolyspora erythraea TaxID=1836 RepID=A4FF62_SACEN|nr:NAD-binding protein [Saccharopolyspora erythraea]EQD86038.1 portal protein [Saccharopolyspora erythraea D]PFG96411.1 TrkA family protein [Saccharopolyspora erythraea NRRL 2338]QRK92914.1 NAD-binding protein [Saccharopolyspora erythraea]CAM02687.1 possible potassium uptake channel [Saccharopolyspora erythraea NRRL 2338]